MYCQHATDFHDRVVRVVWPALGMRSRQADCESNSICTAVEGVNMAGWAWEFGVCILGRGPWFCFPALPRRSSDVPKTENQQLET